MVSNTTSTFVAPEALFECLRISTSVLAPGPVAAYHLIVFLNMFYCTILCYNTYTKLYCTVLFFTQHYTALYYTILHYAIFYAVLCHTILSYTIPFYTSLYVVLHSTMLDFALHFTVLYAVLYPSMPCYAILYYTVLYYVVSYNTSVCCSIPYCTKLYDTVLNDTLYYVIYVTYFTPPRYYTILYWTILYDRFPNTLF